LNFYHLFRCGRSKERIVLSDVDECILIRDCCDCSKTQIWIRSVLSNLDCMASALQPHYECNDPRQGLTECGVKGSVVWVGVIFINAAWRLVFANEATTVKLASLSFEAEPDRHPSASVVLMAFFEHCYSIVGVQSLSRYAHTNDRINRSDGFSIS
jgi:hypothetical protein